MVLRDDEAGADGADAQAAEQEGQVVVREGQREDGQRPPAS
ncbi:hypothetical protein AMB3_3034 [plant metagenome]